MEHAHDEPRFSIDPTTIHPHESKLVRQFAGQQGPGGWGAGQESLGDHGLGSYGMAGQQGFEPEHDFFDDLKANGPSLEGLEPQTHDEQAE